jgi:hypothetical protein
LERILKTIPDIETKGPISYNPQLLSARGQESCEYIRKVLVQPGFPYKIASAIVVAYLSQTRHFMGCDDHDRQSRKVASNL